MLTFGYTTLALDKLKNKWLFPWRWFYSSSNPKLLEGTSEKVLDLNNGPKWDHGVPKCSSGLPEFESGVFCTLQVLWGTY